MNTLQDDAAMAGASGTRTVAAADGRSLTIAEWGAPDGFPVFSLHGTPGSRFVGQANASAYASVGARVITYDRPGYGGSDRFRGRRVVDSVADVSAIADNLGIDRFAVTGGSWGGPHSLAVAARLPERVTRAACIAGVAPFDMPGFDWFADMDAVNVEELGWALEGEDVLARNIERVAARMRGFDVTEIRVPTRVLYGLTDVLVPRQHGDWLAHNVPGAEAVIDEQGGHVSDPRLETERIGWLAQPV